MTLKRISRYFFGGLFIAAGLNHFLNEPFYVRIVPPYIPAPQLMVKLSGVAEVGLGASMLYHRSARLAAWGLIGLLLAVFPANVHMATHSEEFAEFKPAMLWTRLPFQAIFVAWAYWHTRRD